MHDEVERRGLDATVAAGHSHTLEHARRSCTCTDRAGRAVLALDTVTRTESGEAVALHDAREALAFARGDHVDAQRLSLPRSEDVSRDLLADRVFRRVR